MKPRLTIFFATDIHGSERVFRKFLNAASFYGADAVIFGGDITGKSLVPVVEVRPGRFEARLFGRTHAVAEGTELDDLEDRIRTNGFYPYRTTPDEVAILADPAHLRAAFTRVMAETAERWVTLADEKLRAAGIPALMMPGNDDEPMVKDLLAQGDWIIDAEGRRVELEGFQVHLRYPRVHAGPPETLDRRAATEQLRGGRQQPGVRRVGGRRRLRITALERADEGVPRSPDHTVGEVNLAMSHVHRRRFVAGRCNSVAASAPVRAIA